MNFDFDWKKTLSAVAPVLGTALGGPLGGMAAKVIAEKVIGKPDATEDEIAEAVSSGDPKTMLALKQAEQDFQARMRELGIKEEQLHAEDRASARDREAKTGDSATPRILAFVIIAGFFGIVAFVLLKGLNGLETGTATLAGTLVGYVSAKAEQVVAYYFGSSAGSKAKDAMLKAVK